MNIISNKKKRIKASLKRCTCLEHYPKAFTNNGLFFPIVLHNGQVIGNWDKSEKKKSVDLKYSWFRQVADMDEETLERERQKFARFLGK